MAVFAPLRLGDLTLESPVMLAPMCGVCDRPFLEVCRDIDPVSVLATEMVSANALTNGGRNTTEMVDFDSVDGPVMIQIFGHDAAALAAGSRVIEEAGADLISMNFGCPAKKIVKNCDGAALLRTPERIGELVEACVKATRLPMVCKMRIGWDDTSRNYMTVARIIQEAGSHAIAVHGRTREQGYSGTADWEAIAEIARGLDIPVIGNGDIDSPETAQQRMKETGVAGVMIGRAAMGNPWIIRRTAHLLTTGELLPEPTWEERLSTAWRHAEALVAFKGERVGVFECRKHLSWYTTGLPGSAELRQRINHAKTADELFALLRGAGAPLAA
ncbi:MAG: tRNA dihydrouridine synthase DusB [Candidatus Sericytochromatia bacterium]|nr:tRNA dihydrouridine synthase DusB [Candidatus Sericytochromatia bacterium]